MIEKRSKIANIRKIYDENGKEIKDDTENIGFELLKAHEMPLDFNSALNQLIADKGYEEGERLAYLYKFDHPVTGKKKSFIEQFTDDIPDLNDIGTTFGSGRFVMMVTFCDHIDDKTGRPAMASYTFRIHKRYDQIASKHLQESSLQQNSLMMGDNMGTTVTVLKEIMSLFLPLIAQSQKPIEQNKDMTNVYSNFNHLMRKNMNDNYEAMAEMQKRHFLENEEEGEGVEQSTIIQMIEPWIEKILPMFDGRQTAAKKVQQRATIGMIKALPEYKQLMRNTADLKNLTSYLNQNGDGDAVKRVLSQLGIKKDGTPKKKVKTNV